MDRLIRGIFWIIGYLALVCAPLIILFFEHPADGRGFAADFNVALAFAATAMMGMMFFLTARSRSVGSSIGIDIIYYFHRRIALAAYGFVLIHVATVLWVNRRFTVEMAREGLPWGVRFGVVALVFLSMLVIASIWRKELGIPYEVWRLWHVLMAVAVLCLSLLHIFTIAYYGDSVAKRVFWGVMALSWISTTAWIHLLRPWTRRRRPYKVVALTPEAGGAWTLTLEPVGHAGITFRPGQFAWLAIGQSAFTLDEHPFSIASSACHPERLSFTIKELGDFTRRLKEIPLGETVYLDGPHGSFSTDQHDAAQYVFFAGGIGITPVMSILRTLADRGDRRRLILIYGCKTLEEMTFREEVRALTTALDLTFVEVPERPPQGWPGEGGFVDEPLVARYLPDFRSGAKYFLCGPGPMKTAIERALFRQRVPLEHIYSELFDLV